MKIGMHIILFVHAVWLQSHPCLKGNIRETWACASSLPVLQVLHIYLQSLHMPYHTFMCTLQIYKSTVQRLASHSLFMYIQIVNNCLNNSPYLHMQISTTPLPGYTHIFQQYL